MEPSKAPSQPIPSATVVILRDRPGGIEVFMVVRHHAIDFASGALVFPGGKVEPADSDPAWGDLGEWAGAPTAHRSYVVAAARETFEEAGLVLARRRGTPSLVSAEEAHRLVATYRKPVHDGSCSFRKLMTDESLLLAAEHMVPFAHWITPEAMPKRFDTLFYVVAAPVEQLGAHDGSESVDGLWISPQQALKDAEAGTRTIVFATQMNLRKLAQFRTVAEAVSATRTAPIVPVMPKIEKTATGRILRIPAEAGYGITELTIPAS